MIKKIFSIALIVFGSFLEIYYYQFRFQNDGIETWLAITIGIALTLFLCLTILQRETTLTKILIIALIIYSVFATSAGQSFSLSLFQKTETAIDIKELYNQEEIKEIRYRINQIDKKYKQIQSGINITADTLYGRAHYRTALKNAENKQKELNKERSGLQKRLSELRVAAISHDKIEKKKTNIYEFYNTLTGLSVKWLQFTFQTILSIFIAFMAPLGIIAIQTKKTRRYTKRKPIEATDWRPLVERWVHASWIGKRSGKSNNILPESTFLEFTSAHGQDYTKKQYKIIKKAAERKKCIDKDVIIVYNEEEAIKRILQEVCNGRSKERSNKN